MSIEASKTVNHINAKEILSFRRKIISVHIDDIPVERLICNLTDDPSYDDLWCAWLLNGNDNTSKYIWALLDEKRNCNLPLLLCPDDMDFWCTVIVAQVSFSADTVTWNKIGNITGKIDNAKLINSGIKDIASWTDSDWEKYGDTLSFLDTYDIKWEQWCSKNWQEEEKRRIWNYFHPYFNDDKNINWLKCPAFTFNVNDYNLCVSEFRQFKY